MSATMLAKGVLTWIPGVRRAFYNRDASRGTDSPKYCYGVWMKHLTLLSAHGMKTIPRRVLELGPGASIGTGVAALLSGAESYVAIDQVAHACPEANIAVFRELVELFLRRAPRPSPGFPPIDEHLDARLFPGGILTEPLLDIALHARRLEQIERDVRSLGAPGANGRIRYHTWETLDDIDDASIDLVFSHVVLNHVEDLEAIYATCGRWVAPGGWMSHHIDFTCLNSAREWNGHLAYGDLAWRIVAGNRPYFVSREPLQKHMELLDRCGFDVVHLIRGCRTGGIRRDQLAPRWRGISDLDLKTQTGFFVCRRRG
jgi:SAM-dependent methyltransferase